MSKREINKILKSLNDLEDIKYFEEKYNELLKSIDGVNEKFRTITDKMDERVGTTLSLVLEGYGNVIKLTKELWDKANELEKEQFIAWLNDSTALFDEALHPLDEVLRSWPEYIMATKKEDVDGKDA